MSMHAFRRRFWPAYVLGLATALAAMGAWQVLTPAAVAQDVTRPAPKTVGTFDAARQRNDMIKELRAANQKLAEMTKLLGELRELAKEQSRP